MVSPSHIFTVHVPVFLTGNKVPMFCLQMTHRMNQLQVLSGEQELIEVLYVDLSPLGLLDRYSNGRQDGSRPLNPMIKVPCSEEDSMFLAHVRINTVVHALTPGSIIRAFTAEQSDVRAEGIFLTSHKVHSITIILLQKT